MLGMAQRFEDRGVTLRLFQSEDDALAYPGARDPMRYATGWIVRNEADRWVDAIGLLPASWEPAAALIGAEG